MASTTHPAAAEKISWRLAFVNSDMTHVKNTMKIMMMPMLIAYALSSGYVLNSR